MNRFLISHEAVVQEVAQPSRREKGLRFPASWSQRVEYNMFIRGGGRKERAGDRSGGLRRVP